MADWPVLLRSTGHTLKRSRHVWCYSSTHRERVAVAGRLRRAVRRYPGAHLPAVTCKAGPVAPRPPCHLHQGLAPAQSPARRRWVAESERNRRLPAAAARRRPPPAARRPPSSGQPRGHRTREKLGSPAVLRDISLGALKSGQRTGWNREIVKRNLHAF